MTVKQPINTPNLSFNSFFASKWGNKYDKAQRVLDSEILRGTEPYIPLLTGNLINSGIRGTRIGSGVVQWLAIYARKQYYLPRVGTQTGKLRGGFWFERWRKVSGDKTVKKVKKEFGV